MAKIKRIKIYTHHKRFFDLTFENANKIKLGIKFKLPNLVFIFFYSVGLFIINFFKLIIKSIINFCFFVGNLILETPVKIYNGFKNELSRTQLLIPHRLKLFTSKPFLNSLFLFFLFLTVSIISISGLSFVAKAFDIKAKIMKTAFIGNAYLNSAKESLLEVDLSTAEQNFTLALNTFTQGQKDLEEGGDILNNLLKFIPQKNDAERLLKVATLLSETGKNYVAIDRNIKTLKLTSAGIVATEKPTKEVFEDLELLINESKNKISLSTKLTEKINIKSLPFEQQESFLDLKEKLSISNNAINNFSQLFTIISQLLIGEKKVLILFQNNNELRATGGFMGTFGALDIKHGLITKINVSSIYDLDGQLKETIKPPEPILNLSDRWFLRDANWFANFPDSAKKISGFFEKEGGETPEIIISLTPNLIVDWLKIIGPVHLEQYGVTLDAENFVEVTQVATSLSNNLPTNSPKQLLADLVPVLLERLSELDSNSWVNAILAVQNNLSNKQISIYSRNKETQLKLNEFNWNGSVKKSDRDYLHIVSSNLGGTKTDLNIDETIKLSTSILEDGTVKNELIITRTNKLPKLEETHNDSFIRIFVPQGSKLISNVGFDYINLEYPKELTYKIDDEVLLWQKKSVKDVLTGTLIGEEAGKTFFGNWQKLNGGETKTIKLTYELPFKISNIDRYSLMIQKQLGSTNKKISWSLNFPKYQIAWKNFDPNELNSNNLISDIILDKDVLLGLVLQKNK